MAPMRDYAERDLTPIIAMTPLIAETDDYFEQKRVCRDATSCAAGALACRLAIAVSGFKSAGQVKRRYFRRRAVCLASLLHRGGYVVTIRRVSARLAI